MFFIDSKSTKVGFSISTKVGNAVVRNLIKRRLRAIVHTLLPSFKTNFQIVFVAKPQIASFDFLQTDRQVHTLLSKSGILWHIADKIFLDILILWLIIQKLF